MSRATSPCDQSQIDTGWRWRSAKMRPPGSGRLCRRWSLVKIWTRCTQCWRKTPSQGSNFKGFCSSWGSGDHPIIRRDVGCVEEGLAKISGKFLHWCLACSNVLQQLHHIVRSYAAMQASEAESERLWSATSINATDARATMLNVEQFCSLVIFFLQSLPPTSKGKDVAERILAKITKKSTAGTQPPIKHYITLGPSWSHKCK